MKAQYVKQERRARRKRGLRKRIVGTSERPRLTVYRSLQHMYAQIIDDMSGRTLVSASSAQAKTAGGNVKAAESVGAAVAERAKAAGITKVAFDRNGFKYHGRVKAVAEAARKGGLEF